MDYEGRMVVEDPLEVEIVDYEGRFGRNFYGTRYIGFVWCILYRFFVSDDKLLVLGAADLGLPLLVRSERRSFSGRHHHAGSGPGPDLPVRDADPLELGLCLCNCQRCRPVGTGSLSVRAIPRDRTTASTTPRPPAPDKPSSRAAILPKRRHSNNHLVPPGSETLPPVPNHPTDSSRGSRELSFSSNIFIERDDFQEDAPKDFFRFSAVGSEVKLRGCYVIKLAEIVKDEGGKVVKLKCTHDKATRDSMPADRKVKGRR